MPLLKPGQALPGINDAVAPELQGVKVETNSILFQERLLKLFRPYEYVEIKNIDDDPLYWQYMPDDAESITEVGSQREIYRSDPELWGIQAGGSDVLIGACAYRALDVLYKNYAAKKVLREQKSPTDPRYAKNGDYAQISFNFSDANIQEYVIKHAYVGKINPTFGRPSVTENATPAPQAPAEPADPNARPVVAGVAETATADAKPVAKATANASTRS